MVQAQFDYEAERSYYVQPVTDIRAYEWLGQDMRSWVPDYPHIFAGKRVLDIGAGEALQAMLVCERYQPQLYVALDLILHQMAAARTRLHELPAMALVNGDTYRLPFPSSSFDLVLGNGILHHLPNLPMVATEVRRVLRLGGLYVGREPNFDNYVVRRRVLGGHRSENEYAIRPSEILPAFSAAGFDCKVHYFWRRFPWIRWRLLAVSMRIHAWKRNCRCEGS